MLDIESLRTHGHEAIIVATFFTVLTTIAVVLRLATFLVTQAQLGWSEILLLLAQGCWYAQYGILMHVLVVGRSIKSMDDPRLRTVGFKGLYLVADLYFPLVFFTNSSLLFLYRRLFPISAFKRAVTAVLVAHVIWFIPSFLVGIFICRPPSTLWLQPDLIHEKCVSFDTFYAIILSVELLLDVWTLGLPIFYVFDLKVSFAQRAELIFIFLLGGLVIGTGVIRIIKSIDPENSSIDYILELFWLTIHVGTAIICACLPTYRPLIVKSASVLSSYRRKIFPSVAYPEAQGSGGTYEKSDGFRESGQKKGRKESWDHEAVELFGFEGSYGNFAGDVGLHDHPLPESSENSDAQDVTGTCIVINRSNGPYYTKDRDLYPLEDDSSV